MFVLISLEVILKFMEEKNKASSFPVGTSGTRLIQAQLTHHAWVNEYSATHLKLM